MKSKTIIPILIITTVLILFFVARYCTRFWEIDSCLDRGGRWNYQSNKCEGLYEIDITKLTNYYWSTDFDTLINREYLTKGKMLDSISQSPSELIEILNARKAKSKIEFKEFLKDTLIIQIFESEYLTEQMGTTGAHCYLGETIFTLTENPNIKFVRIEMEAGSHANPGIYSRRNFMDLLKN
jgi:hypothetical protein